VNLVAHSPSRAMSHASRWLPYFGEGAFARLFMPRYRPSTRERYDALLRQSVMSFFGEMKLVAIDAAARRGYAAMLSAKCR
jgi:hypothetical protein